MGDYYSPNEYIPEVDKAFAKFVMWVIDNTNRREKDLIYVTENYSKAWLTASEIRMGGKPNKGWKEQLKRINKALGRLGYPTFKTYVKKRPLTDDEEEILLGGEGI